MIANFAPSLAHVLVSEGGSFSPCDRVLNSIFNRQTATDEFVERGSGNADLFSKGFDRQSASLPKDILPLVAALLRRSRPTTIQKFVALLIVNPVQRFSIGALTHIRQKRLKRMSPPLAHFNTSPTVCGERCAVRIIAALLGGHPAHVGRIARVSSVRSADRSNAVVAKASTTGAIAAGKFMSGHGFDRSAVTDTDPFRARPIAGNRAVLALQNKQSPVAHSGPVNKLTHARPIR
jgi:hypothetical protein